jgi:hypothetical protein
MAKAQVVPTGFRKDTKPFFTQHVLSIPTKEKQVSPFIVVEGTSVSKLNTVEELLTYPDEVDVLQTWPGKKRSDVFYFTVKDLKDHIKGGK